MNRVTAAEPQSPGATIAANEAILRYLEETTERRGRIERLPGLPGAKRPDEEVVLVGFPF